MRKLLVVASTMVFGLFLAGCHDASKDKIAGERARQELISRQQEPDVRVSEQFPESNGRAIDEVAVVKKEARSGPSKRKARNRDIEISPKRAKCVKSGKVNCFLIRNVGQTKWRTSARVIEGFKYEQGYHYLVRVKESLDENNKQRWKLVKVIEKKRDK